MSDVRTIVEETVAPLLARGEIVDVYAVAAQIKYSFPQYSLEHLARIVFYAVYGSPGNSD